MKLYQFNYNESRAGGIMIVAAQNKEAAVAMRKANHSSWSFDFEIPYVECTTLTPEPEIVATFVYLDSSAND